MNYKIIYSDRRTLSIEVNAEAEITNPIMTSYQNRRQNKWKIMIY